MSREQYQQETQHSNDLFEEYLENLPEPDVQISSQVEQDVRQIDNEAKEKKKSRKLRVAGYIAAAVLALGLNLFLGNIAEANKPKPEPPVVVVDNPHYSLIMLDMLKNMEKDVSSDTTAGTSLKNAEIQIHGRTYHLPNSLMMFLQNGWAVENTEYLETKGVPVIGYGTEELPAFYTRHSGFKVDYRIDTPEELAAAFKAKMDCGLKGGMLVTNPIPEQYSMPKEVIDKAIDQALREMDEAGIHGKQCTPFLLAKVKDLTGGESLASNIQLVLNNARLAAKTAKALCEK